MSAHTPGPWSVFRGIGCSRDGIEAEGSNFSVVLVGAKGDLDGVKGRTSREAKANARLIAAAPTMLAALKQIHRMGYEDFGDRLMVEEAIKQATGKRP